MPSNKDINLFSSRSSALVGANVFRSLRVKDLIRLGKIIRKLSSNIIQFRLISIQSQYSYVKWFEKLWSMDRYSANGKIDVHLNNKFLSLKYQDFVLNNWKLVYTNFFSLLLCSIIIECYAQVKYKKWIHCCINRWDTHSSLPFSHCHYINSVCFYLFFQNFSSHLFQRTGRLMVAFISFCDPFSMLLALQW